MLKSQGDSIQKNCRLFSRIGLAIMAVGFLMVAFVVIMLVAGTSVEGTIVGQRKAAADGARHIMVSIIEITDPQTGKKKQVEYMPFFGSGWGDSKAKEEKENAKTVKCIYWEKIPNHVIADNFSGKWLHALAVIFLGAIAFGLGTLVHRSFLELEKKRENHGESSNGFCPE